MHALEAAGTLAIFGVYFFIIVTTAVITVKVADAAVAIIIECRVTCSILMRALIRATLTGRITPSFKCILVRHGFTFYIAIRACI